MTQNIMELAKKMGEQTEEQLLKGFKYVCHDGRCCSFLQDFGIVYYTYVNSEGEMTGRERAYCIVIEDQYGYGASSTAICPVSATTKGILIGPYLQSYNEWLFSHGINSLTDLDKQYIERYMYGKKRINHNDARAMHKILPQRATSAIMSYVHQQLAYPISYEPVSSSHNSDKNRLISQQRWSKQDGAIIRQYGQQYTPEVLYLALQRRISIKAIAKKSRSIPQNK